MGKDYSKKENCTSFFLKFFKRSYSQRQTVLQVGGRSQNCKSVYKKGPEATSEASDP